ncbi:uncharacterized protein LOC116803678 isoform X2 [Drosophila mojavensis]|uniref:uncharacterized protein LOC116803678 isoform X2 n=1 Tax=Drosophila mojavensis TaxID=7230 RepID=UPI0013EECDF2|nr:uncharacterized protein LOC116803678 isoform X2 [Drosophila mojavensis]
MEKHMHTRGAKQSMARLNYRWFYVSIVDDNIVKGFGVGTAGEMETFLNGKDNGEDCDADKNNGEDEIPRKRTKYGISGVWYYFKKCADGKSAKCTKCGQIFQTSGNTTNLSAHLKRKHRNLSPTEEPKAAGPILTLLQTKYDASSARKKLLDSALTSYITSDLRPY